MVPVVVGLIVVFGLFLLSQYNGLVRLRNRIEAGWAQVDVQLKRRYELIPNLVEAVKAYAAHEKGTLDAVIAARNAAMNSSAGVGGKAAAEEGLSGSLKSLFALSESYPDLKANQNYLNLQEELTSTEDKIAYARQYYNDEVRSYNTKTQTFPSALIAKRFGFRSREYFQIDEASKGPVPVSF